MKPEFEIVPYGEILHTLSKERWRSITHRAHETPEFARQWLVNLQRPVFVSFSQDIDDNFVNLFRTADKDARVLVLNKGLSNDTLLERIMQMQIRSSTRFYVADYVGCGKTHLQTAVWDLLKRFSAAAESQDSKEQILDARIEDGRLRLVSMSFERMDVPISIIGPLKHVAAAKLHCFEVDEDGAFVFWPDLDVHLGWRQLQQLVNPITAFKALEKSRKFNQRYGSAVRQIRELAGLTSGNVPGLSEKQLSRIEKGECRLTTNAIEALAKAHELEPNAYMKKLAEALKQPASAQTRG